MLALILNLRKVTTNLPRIGTEAPAVQWKIMRG